LKHKIPALHLLFIAGLLSLASAAPLFALSIAFLGAVVSWRRKDDRLLVVLLLSSCVFSFIGEEETLGFIDDRTFMALSATALMCGALIHVRLKNERLSTDHTKLFALLLTGLGLASISSYLGFNQGYNGFSRSFVMGSAAVACLLGMQKGSGNRQIQYLLHCLPAILLFVTGLSAAGIYIGHSLVLITALAGAQVPLSLTGRQSVTLAVCSSTCFAVGLLVSNTRFTLLLVFSIAFLVAFYSVQEPKRMSNLVRPLFMLGLLLGLIFVAFCARAEGRDLEVTVLSDRSIVEAVVFKGLVDRGPLWRQTINDLLSTSYLFAPSGRPLQVQDYGIIGPAEWSSGSHNVLLEALHEVGIAGGAVIVIVQVCVLLSASKQVTSTVRRSPTDGATRLALFSALLFAFLVAMVLGQYSLEANVGYAWFLTLGLVAQSNSLCSQGNTNLRVKRRKRVEDVRVGGAASLTKVPSADVP
jgi:hypothetical protein